MWELTKFAQHVPTKGKEITSCIVTAFGNMSEVEIKNQIEYFIQSAMLIIET